jgi:MerR family transcriptional regulator, redox-sensitive transcriptional activator SoxR
MSLSIGEVAARCGLAPSTLRYYERLGLLPAPARRSGRRRYGDEAMERLTVVVYAKDMGFSLLEIRELFTDGKPYSTRMRRLATRKLVHVERMIARAHAMQAMLRTALHCRCLDVPACGRRLLAATKTPRRR